MYNIDRIKVNLNKGERKVLKYHVISKHDNLEAMTVEDFIPGPENPEAKRLVVTLGTDTSVIIVKDSTVPGWRNATVPDFTKENIGNLLAYANGVTPKEITLEIHQITEEDMKKAEPELKKLREKIGFTPLGDR